MTEQKTEELSPNRDYGVRACVAGFLAIFAIHAAGCACMASLVYHFPPSVHPPVWIWGVALFLPPLLVALLGWALRVSDIVASIALGVALSGLAFMFDFFDPPWVMLAACFLGGWAYIDTFHNIARQFNYGTAEG
ncbi:MAG TPA: hypothetical protein V6C76_01835 [Drouetiella sp.]